MRRLDLGAPRAPTTKFELMIARSRTPASATAMPIAAIVTAKVGALVLLVVVAASASSAARAGATAATSTAGCSTRGLVVWLDTRGSGTAGSTYYSLQFTDLTGHACTLLGYPGVSAVNLDGRQLGRAAARNDKAPAHVVSLPAGGSVKAILQITDVGVFSHSTCRPATAAGLRVYPPNRFASKVIPFPFGACSRSGPVYLHVEAVQATG